LFISGTVTPEDFKKNWIEYYVLPLNTGQVLMELKNTAILSED
jgi:hypothetical protein